MVATGSLVICAWTAYLLVFMVVSFQVKWGEVTPFLVNDNGRD
jgi:hypothetical protein